MSECIITSTVQVPIETIKETIDRDFLEYMYFLNAHTVFGEFPLFANTKTMLSILRDVGIEFDTRTGQWKN